MVVISVGSTSTWRPSASLTRCDLPASCEQPISTTRRTAPSVIASMIAGRCGSGAHEPGRALSFRLGARRLNREAGGRREGRPAGRGDLEGGTAAREVDPRRTPRGSRGRPPRSRGSGPRRASSSGAEGCGASPRRRRRPGPVPEPRVRVRVRRVGHAPGGAGRGQDADGQRPGVGPVGGRRHRTSTGSASRARSGARAPPRRGGGRRAHGSSAGRSRRRPPGPGGSRPGPRPGAR